MSDRPAVPEAVAVQVLVDNQHVCCICRTPNLHVQLHHIDEDTSNNSPANLAPVCGSCHSRVTGDEGLGRRFTRAEVAEFKRRWELACAAAIRAHAERLHIERYLEERIAAERVNGMVDFMPLFSNPELAAKMGFDTGKRLARTELEQLVSNIRTAGKLRTARPRTMEEYETETDTVISETILATKVIIPQSVLKTSVPGVKELAVWVADPEVDVLTARSEKAYDFAGTFLYLVTPLYDDLAATTFYTGCSALQVISNLATGTPFITQNHEEPLGRRNCAHPTDKLRSIGGIIVDRRPVEVLYRPRYMSDEQCFTKDEKVYRTHDLLGYPLYIANSSDSLMKRAQDNNLKSSKAGKKS